MRRARMIVLASGLLLLAALPARAPSGEGPDSLGVLRTRARAERPARPFGGWMRLAEAARVPAPDETLPPKLREQSEQKLHKSKRFALYREAISHLAPAELAALAAALPDPELDAAMVRALDERGRRGEACSECRDALARWGPSPALAEACRECVPGLLPWGAGGAARSVFHHWLVLPPGREGSPAYQAGLLAGARDPDLVSRIKVGSVPAEFLPVSPQFLGSIARRDPSGLLVGDPTESGGALAAALGGYLQIPYLSLASAAQDSPTARSAVPRGSRRLVPAPGPEARARLLLEAARKQGARKLVLVVPDQGGEPRFAHALTRIAQGLELTVETLEYAAGRRDHKADAARLRASGADAAALLGPGEESADWLPALRLVGRPLLVLGTDELDPAGYHEPARRAAKGAIFVRSHFTPVSEAAAAWGPFEATCYVAGWIVGDALAKGADTPAALEQAFETRLGETDAHNGWFIVPASVARVEVLRVRGGRAEVLP